jgi:hypothetical protein
MQQHFPFSGQPNESSTDEALLKETAKPVVVRLKAWRAKNNISQAEASEVLRRRGS